MTFSFIGAQHKVRFFLENNALLFLHCNGIKFGLAIGVSHPETRAEAEDNGPRSSFEHDEGKDGADGETSGKFQASVD